MRGWSNDSLFVVDAVQEIMRQDRRVTSNEILHQILKAVKRIISSDLRHRKIYVRWVSRLLDRMAAVRKVLEMFPSEGEDLFAPIVTGDKTWIHHTTYV